MDILFTHYELFVLISFENNARSNNTKELSIKKNDCVNRGSNHYKNTRNVPMKQ